MQALDFKSKGMMVKSHKGAFTLFTHLSWTGRILLGKNGEPFASYVLDLCPEIDLGSVCIVLNCEFGTVVNARADHGNKCYVHPEPGQQLALVTAGPATFTAKAFEAIASAMVGGDEVLNMPEVHSANARHFIARLHELGVGDPPQHILS